MPWLAGALVFVAVFALFAGGDAGDLRPAVSRGGRVRAAVRSPVAALGAALARLGLGGMGPIARLAREACGMVDLLPGPFAQGLWAGASRGEVELGLLAGLCAAGAGLGAAISLSALGALVGGVAALGSLAIRAMLRRGREEAELEGAMPEAFGALAIALGSGHSLSQAMRFVGSHAREPVRTEFMRVSFSIDCGVPAAEALDMLLTRLPAPGLDLVTLALKVSQRTGAPLRGLLAEASRLVGTRIELKRMLDVKTSQARMSARLVAAMPVGMVCVLTLLSPDFRRGVSLPLGAASVALSLVLNGAAWAIIGKIMKVRL